MSYAKGYGPVWMVATIEFLDRSGIGYPQSALLSDCRYAEFCPRCERVRPHRYIAVPCAPAGVKLPPVYVCAACSASTSAPVVRRLRRASARKLYCSLRALYRAHLSRRAS